MDLNSAMTLEEWRQVPPLPGLEKMAERFERQWEDLETEKVRTTCDAYGNKYVHAHGTITFIPGLI